VQHFLKKYSEAYGKPIQGLTRRAQILLLQHDWPGNVRELENVIASAAITTVADFIDIGIFRNTCKTPTAEVPPRTKVGAHFHWKKFVAFTFSACWICAKAIVCAPHRYWESDAPALPFSETSGQREVCGQRCINDSLVMCRHGRCSKTATPRMDHMKSNKPTGSTWEQLQRMTGGKKIAFRCR